MSTRALRQTDVGQTWALRSVDTRYTGLSMLADVGAPGGERRLGVMWEGGPKRFDGDGIWFTTLPFAKDGE